MSSLSSSPVCPVTRLRDTNDNKDMETMIEFDIILLFNLYILMKLFE